MRWVLLVAFISAVLGCESKSEVRLPTVEHFECARCHAIPGARAPHPNLDCSGCHRAVFDGGLAGLDQAEVAVWRTRLHHLRIVPTLVGADRLERAWFERFVMQPHDIRPGLSESMPRLPIGRDEAARLADELGLGTLTPDEPLRGEQNRGRELYVGLACFSCHHFTGSGAPTGPAFDRPVAGAVRLAPDLRYARERLSRATANRWLERPSAVKADAAMKVEIADPVDRRDLVAYLFDTPLTPVARPVPPDLPPAVDRPVTWAEVDAALFHATCRHCHSEGGTALSGEGGPGNSGGFGYPGADLVLSSYDGIRRGSRRGDGSRRDVLAPEADGVAPILAHLMARHREVAGEYPTVLGMPLGLPPVELGTIALLRGWIEQGAPR